MRAAVYTSQGPAREVLQLVEAPAPVPGDGQVLVRVHASGINPSDVKMRSGVAGIKPAFDRIIPHSDGAGVIEAVGVGVDRSRIGERVWIWNGQWKRPSGTAADYIALPSAQAVRLPDATSFEVGACLGIPLLTAIQAMNLCGAAPGDTILVSGGAGAVAHYAIQIANQRGIRVLSTVSSEEKAAQARNAGALETIDYKKQDVGAAVAEQTGGRGVQSIIELDLTANAALIPKVLARHGVVVAYGMSSPIELQIPARWMLQNNVDLRLFMVYELSQADRSCAQAEIEALLEGGRLIHRLDSVLPLAEISEAHERVERGALGKVVLSLS